jgi:superfamily II DNA or RNA helicase
MSDSMAGKTKEANAGVRTDAVDDISSSPEAGAGPTVTKAKAIGSSGYDDERRRLERQLTVEESQLEEAERTRDAIVEPPNAAAAALPDGQLTQTFSTEQKLTIFRRLFRGREDVYPVRWASKKTGASGYMPECANKFDRRVCDIEHVRCHACAHRAYRPVTDNTILTHLKGQHVMGVYPLLPNDTCWFLAIDFDKDRWQADIAAVRNTCRTLDIPVYIERSRSGNGGHLWFFFSEAVPAHMARKLGSYLLTETMSRYPRLSFASYDRLFPNQDTMPKGGFGNLIALPLQGASRSKGNSVFVDDHFVAYPGDEQWSLLSRAVRLTPDRVAQIANQAMRNGRVLNAEPVPSPDDEAKSPWTRSPSGKPKRIQLSGPLPSQISGVLAQRLFVERAGLPPALINRVRRLAAFQNPEFYKRQAARRPIAGTPRIIYLAEDTEHHVALPRGCAADLAELAHEAGIPLVVDDKRHIGSPLSVTFQGSLTDVQTRALSTLSAEDTGVLVAPPGAGKTVIAVALIAKRARNTLVLVHRRPLLDQWRSQLALFLGIGKEDIGEISGTRRRANGRLDVAMLQTLLHDKGVDDVVAQYGQVIVDECHHIPAVTFERVVSEATARYVTGLTATPRRQDGRDPIIRMQLGPTRFQVSAKSQAAARPFRHVLIVRNTNFTGNELGEDPMIAQLYAALASDAQRNELIIGDVVATIREGRSPIVLTERREHVAFFADRLQRYSKNLFVLTGGNSEKLRRDLFRRMAQIPDDEPRVIVATGKFVGEGFDDVKLDTLFLTLPVSWKGTVEQYVGRLHRLHSGKKEVRVFDYVDHEVPKLTRMFAKRLKTYRSLGYSVEDPSDEFELLADPDAEADVTSFPFEMDEF